MLAVMVDDSSWVETMPEIYDRYLGPALFAPFAAHLAELAARYSPRSVGELAAGSGVLTSELVRALPDARITATDLNPAMVAWGERRVSAAMWLIADAQALDFPDAAFDLIACQFGVMFFPDRAGAFAQAARVLRPGGVYLFAVWDTVESSTFPSALTAALADVLPDGSPNFVARVPHGYHDREQIRADVEAGGLLVESIERVVLPGSCPSAEDLARGFCLGTPLRFALQEHGDLVHLTDAVIENMVGRLGTGPVAGELTALVVTARQGTP